MGPIFSPIKSLIALGNKETINPVSANKTPAVWQEAANTQQSPALLVVDNMLCVLVCVQASGGIFMKRITANEKSSGCGSFLFLLMLL